MTASIIPIDFREKQTPVDIIHDLADILDGASPRLDPSDPDACLGHLMRYADHRAITVAKYYEQAIDQYGQRLIDRDAQRREASNA